MSKTKRKTKAAPKLATVLANAFIRTKVSGSCYVFSTEPMVCPLCRITVPANTEHRCEKKS